MLDYLVPYPEEVRAEADCFHRPHAVHICYNEACCNEARQLQQDLSRLSGITLDAEADLTVSLETRAGTVGEEGYRLVLTPRRASIVGNDNAGLFYGIQTFLQLLLLGDGELLPCVRISDRPRYAVRAYMADMGRASFSLPLLKRIVRILSRLKMNTLHLHLCDDQLNSLRYKCLPLGSENPYAITVADLEELVHYAAPYHVHLMPEVECWGHAGSILYHYPELYGGPGMWSGMSFGLGEPLFDLFEKIFDEIVAVLEPECRVHVGLDEARLSLLPQVSNCDRSRYTPEHLIQRLYDILQQAGRRHARRVTMHLWADHGGRLIPQRIRDKVVVQPWMYFESGEKSIRRYLERYGGKDKPPFMIGTGMSQIDFDGRFGATRIWSQRADELPNVLGLTICQWENNAVADQLLGVYVGADYAWTPDTPKLPSDDPFHERLRGECTLRMRKWQAVLKDGDDISLRHDIGHEIHRGVFCWGEKAGRPVAPTVRG